MLINITGAKKVVPGVGRLPPIKDYDATEAEIRRMINFNDWKIYESSTGRLITKNNVDNIIYGGPSGGGEGGGSGFVGGNDVLDEPITFTDTLGGISAGTTFPTGKSVESIIKQLGNKLVLPKVSLTSNLSSLTYELGTTVRGGITLTANVTKGSSKITKVEFFKNDTCVSTITSNVSNGGNFTYSDGSNITADVNYHVKVTVQEGNKVSSNTISIKFYNPYYYGISTKSLTDLTMNDITSLSKDVSDKSSKEYKFTSNNSYCVVAFPKSHGNLSSILDENGFENVDSWNVSEVDVNNVPYYVYQTGTQIICNNFTYKFIY